MISGQRSHMMIREIQEYFDVEMTSLPSDDWDKVEDIIKRVIKSSRAGKDFRPATNDAAGIDM